MRPAFRRGGHLQARPGRLTAPRPTHAVLGLWASRSELAVTVAFLAATVAVASFMLLYGLGRYPLLDVDEGLYAEVAREMLAGAGYLIPHANGVPYIEKPPLLYWLMAASFWLFGAGPFSARLVPALATLALCGDLIYLGRRVGDLRLGTLAALVLSTSFGLVVVARTVLFDPLLTAFTAIALLHFYLWYRERRALWLRIAYASLALAVMSKGLVAIVIVAGTAMLFLAWEPDRRALMRKALDPVGIAVFVALAAPWHIWMMANQPHFTWFYFINEHVLRFLGLRKPHDYHTGPWWYYAPRLLLGFLPWTPFLLLTVVSPRTSAAPKGLMRLCWIWLTLNVVFFSASVDKGSYYEVVSAPPLALLVAAAIRTRVRTGRYSLLQVSAAISIAVGAILTAVFLSLRSETWMLAQGLPRAMLFQPAIVFGAATGIGLLALAAWSRRHGHLGAGLLAAAVLPLLLLLVNIAHARADYISSEPLASSVSSGSPRPARLFVYADYEDVATGLRFKTDRPLYIVDSQSRDLAFGCDLAGKRAPCVSHRSLFQYGKTHRAAVLVLRSRLCAFVALDHSGEFRYVRGSAGKRLLLTNYQPSHLVVRNLPLHRARPGVCAPLQQSPMRHSRSERAHAIALLQPHLRLPSGVQTLWSRL